MDLATAELTILGRIAAASNTTLLCRLGPDGPRAERVVYKPVRGEVPLWDFPDGTLAGREVATYLVAQALGWDLIPETVLRDGPLGPGMVQRWLDEPGDETRNEPDDELGGADPIELFPLDELPRDYRAVFSGYIEGARGEIEEVALAHANDERLRRMAVFDVIVNNADRKGGHILVGPDSRVYGVDHGICLHAEPKLRTVLWGWAGEPLPDDVLPDLERFVADPPDLREYITSAEQRALLDRTRALISDGVMPEPPSSRPIPWPPF